MITPIMVALIAGALASVPAAWKEGSAALGVNRWRTIVRVSLRTARPGDRRRDRARHRARARRGDHALDGLGQPRLRGQPARRPDLPVRAGQAARGDDRPGIRGTTIGPMATRSTRSAPCCSSRRRCCRSRAGPPSSRSSATGSAPDGGRAEPRRPRAPAGAARGAPAPPRQRLLAADRPRRLLAVLGRRHRPVPDRGGDRRVHADQGNLLPAPAPVRDLAGALAAAEPGRGLSRSDRGDLHPDRRGHRRSPRRSAWRSRCGCRSTAARRGSRARSSRRSR